MTKNNALDILTKAGHHLTFGRYWEKADNYMFKWNSGSLGKSVSIKPTEKEANALINMILHISVCVLSEKGILKKADDSDIDDISEKGKREIYALAELLKKRDATKKKAKK
ncbi:hypothetical protein [Candidatus Liberibacter sp.]|uniref:hypothetical protein n=1 Tax=Candidatus Liberibacter sp. TaxID=34022 RepID=UPI0015F56A34|nr:hypothetical protein [Candidatus Liberibacter sp.]MBA5724603.1 hypothetical protein [Candidatus Liberibacter sp.]